MIIRQFNSLEEIQKYYDERTDAYIFKEDGKWIDLVIFAFDLKVEANINARDIKAYNIVVWNINALNIEAFEINASNIQCEDINAFNITALNINAGDIDANEIKARDIRYWGVCFAYKNIICTSIKGRKENHKHFVLDGEIEMLENGKLCEKDLNRLEKLEKENQELKEQVNHFEKVIEDMKNPSKLDCTHMFDNCKELKPLTEKKKHKMTSKEGLKLLETRCRFFAQDEDELQETYEAREAIKKDLEILEILKKHYNVNSLTTSLDSLISITINKTDKDFEKIKEWLEE